MLVETNHYLLMSWLSCLLESLFSPSNYFITASTQICVFKYTLDFIHLGAAAVHSVDSEQSGPLVWGMLRWRLTKVDWVKEQSSVRELAWPRPLQGITRDTAGRGDHGPANRQVLLKRTSIVCPDHWSLKKHFSE